MEKRIVSDPEMRMINPKRWGTDAHSAPIGNQNNEGPISFESGLHSLVRYQLSVFVPPEPASTDKPNDQKTEAEQGDRFRFGERANLANLSTGEYAVVNV